MRQDVRFGRILQRLNESGSVGVAELAEQLGVSEASVRRDLGRLEQQNLLTRTHGGAAASGVLYELPMRYRGGQHHEAKRAIAAAAVALITPEITSVGLNGGTTTTEVARALTGHPGLRVVTNALNIASELAVRSTIELVVSGGSARPESYELVGPLAEQTLAHLNLDLAFIGVDGISPGAGLTTHHEVEAQTNRVLAGIADRVVVVADSSKLGKRGFARISDLSMASDLITDSGAPADAVTALRQAGLAVHLVEPD
jgi:DeoR family transcriptional regulator, aga operon transcriptional repressor